MTAEQEVQLLIGKLVFESTSLRHQVAALRKRVEELEAEKAENEDKA